MQTAIKTSLVLFSLLFFSITTNAQKEITIKASPGDAEIYRKISGGVETKIGVGSATLKLDRDVPYFIEVRKDGFLSVSKTITRTKDGAPSVLIKLEDRTVKLNASPADARIFVNNADRGNGPVDALILKGQSITIDVKKPGFVTQSKTYYNKEGQDEPESSHLFKLEDRLISIKAMPADAKIYVDEKKAGDGTADIIIGKDKCVVVKVERLGYASELVTYCNKDNETVPPMSEQIKLKDRLVQFNAIPDDAIIFIDGKEVGKGSHTVKIPEGKATQVLIKRVSYVTEKYELYNKADMQAPEPVYSVQLKTDEAYQQSEESQVANQNFTIEVSSTMPEATAWKLLTSIIQAKFDEIESIDASTSYLRTNWVGTPFNVKSSFPSTVRTRVIITSASRAPLKYNIKIQSEITKVSELISSMSCIGATVNMDQCFEQFSRLLRKYNDIINEAIRRMQEK